VQLRNGAVATEEDIIRFCDGRMPYFMVPRYIAFIKEFPRTPTEKVQKYKLREQAVANLPNLWDREKAGVVISR
jgi:crotonobetaine/carnitine-CoA ligase